MRGFLLSLSLIFSEPMIDVDPATVRWALIRNTDVYLWNEDKDEYRKVTKQSIQWMIRAGHPFYECVEENGAVYLLD